MVELTPSGAIKRISDFRAYSEENHITAAALQEAYKASTDAASALAGQQQFMISSMKGPDFASYRHKTSYAVETYPLGYFSNPRDEQVRASILHTLFACLGYWQVSPFPFCKLRQQTSQTLRHRMYNTLLWLVAEQLRFYMIMVWSIETSGLTMWSASQTSLGWSLISSSAAGAQQSSPPTIHKRAGITPQQIPPDLITNCSPRCPTCIRSASCYPPWSSLAIPKLHATLLLGC